MDDVSIGFNLRPDDPRRADRHNGLVNVVYADGHVKAVVSKLLLELVPAGQYSSFTAFTMGADLCPDRRNYP